MKRTNYIQLFTALAMTAIAGGCADDTFDSIKGFSEDREITLNLNIPGFATPETRSIDNERALKDVKVIFVGAQGAQGSETSLNIDTDHLSNTTKITIPAGTTSLKLIGNYTDNGLTSTATVNYSEVNPNSKDSFVFYGEADVENLQSNETLEVDLYRIAAKTTITVDPAVTDFEIDEVYFYNNPTTANICQLPVISPDNPTVPAGDIYSTTQVQVPATRLEYAENSACGFYHYEAVKDKCFWVIKAKNKGWYKIGYVPSKDENSEGNALPIIRNHHYQFTITQINNDGYSTRDAAVAADPENRLEFTLKDHAPKIIDIIACKDYYLGVSNEVKVEADADLAEITVIESYTNIHNMPAEWITVVSDPEHMIKLTGGKVSFTQTTSPIGTSGTTSDATERIVSIDILSNTSSDDRTAIIKVQFGDLSREVTITQEGKDYFNGANAIAIGVTGNTFGSIDFTSDRLSTLPYSFTSNNVKDYITFLNSTLQGVSEKDMVSERNKGIHFPVYASEYPTYWIPIQTVAGKEDKLEILEGGDYFQISAIQNDSRCKYVQITPTSAGKENYKIWTGRMKFTRAADSVIIYIYVYHTGVIHQLSETHQVEGPSGSKASGWFYYEQVDFVGTDGQLYHVLDRNLGASSNKAYSPTGLTSSANSGACGAYFYIKEDTSSDSKKKEMYKILEADMPAGFNTMATAYHLTDMNIGLMNVSEGAYGRNTIAPSKLSKVYFPLSGNMIGSQHADEAHVNLWSSSILSGNQGFDPKSPEYGYWYRYLDIYGNTTKIRNTRIKNRTDGALSGMPIRCIAGPTPPPGWDSYTVPIGRSRIILTNEAGWDNAIIKYDNVVMKMEADASGSWFIIDLNSKPTSVTFYGSKNSKNYKADRTGIIYPTNGIVTLSNSPCSQTSEELPSTKITIYVYDEADWGKEKAIRIHYWGDESESSWGSQPSMEYVGTSDGHKWFKYEVPVGTTGIIITGDDIQLQAKAEDVQSKFAAHGNILQYNFGGEDDLKYKGYGVPTMSEGTDVYILGGFSGNDWTKGIKMSPNDNGTSSVSVTATGNKYFRFKVDNTQYGPSVNNTEIKSGETKSTTVTSENAFYVSAGTYTITFDPSSKQVSVTGSAATYTKYRIQWYKEYSGIVRPDIYVTNLPTGTRINGSESTSGDYTYNGNHDDLNIVYLEFEVPSTSTGSTVITFYLKTNPHDKNKEKAFTKRWSDDFTDYGGVKTCFINSLD